MAEVSTAARATGGRSRRAYFDVLKVVLVSGVIVGHATLAWTGVGTWVFDEPHVREPLLTVLVLVAVIGALFAIPAFLLVAGVFTPGSLERKGLRRFVIDRSLRLGLPMVFFVLVLSPIVEYVDPDSADWDRGFAAFVPHIWWPPAPGPTWFLGVLLVLSIAYALARNVRPRRPTEPASPGVGQLALAAAAIAVASYVVRLWVPLGVEVWRLALGQAPGWVAGYSLGAIGAERGWFDRLHGRTARTIRWTAWAGIAATALFVGAGAMSGIEMETFAGGGTWHSFVIAALEGVLVVTVPLWLVDLFRRRFDHQGPLGREMSRSAFAAFIVHQVVLVGLVLLSRRVPWPPEVEYLAVAVSGVALSFALASLVIRIPGVSRYV